MVEASKSFTRMRALHPSASLQTFRLVTDNWLIVDESPIQMNLRRDHGYTSAEISFHNRPCHDSKLTRARFRGTSRIAARLENGALLMAELITTPNATMAKSISKVPQQPAGMAYRGVLIVPFDSCHLSILICCRDDGLAGFRDTTVYSKLVAGGKSVVRWQQDPYDARLHDDLMRNLSEDERYDREFPDHPLSRMRRYLRHFEQTFDYERRKLSQPILSDLGWTNHLSNPLRFLQDPFLLAR